MFKFISHSGGLNCIDGGSDRSQKAESQESASEKGDSVRGAGLSIDLGYGE